MHDHIAAERMLSPLPMAHSLSLFSHSREYTTPSGLWGLHNHSILVRGVSRLAIAAMNSSAVVAGVTGTLTATAPARSTVCCSRKSTGSGISTSSTLFRLALAITAIAEAALSVAKMELAAHSIWRDTLIHPANASRYRGSPSAG